MSKERDKIYRELQKSVVPLIRQSQTMQYLKGLYDMWKEIEKVFPEEASRIGKENLDV